ncbi:MAG: GNAT family N-acetyltransferase [Chloroflexi bacterium]|nr:GNAT family N-acetyltransferase [Chloroflexota bacterium]
MAVIVRPATLSDMGEVLAIDASYTTRYVWQMEQRRELDEIVTRFREVRLPRELRVEVSPEWVAQADRWQERDVTLVAEDEGRVVGSLSIAIDNERPVGKLIQVAVVSERRRRGIGATLLGHGRQWAAQRELAALEADVPTKNQPAIRLLLKGGFALCGYNDRYYAGREIALLFNCPLR